MSINAKSDWGWKQMLLLTGCFALLMYGRSFCVFAQHAETKVSGGPTAAAFDASAENLEIADCRRILSQPKPPANRLAVRDALAKRQAKAGTTLLRLGRPELVWPLFRHSDDPALRSYLIRDVGASGVPVDLLIERLQIESDVSSRRALILSFGGFTSQQLPRDRRNSLAEELLRIFREDPDPGVHSAVDWLLRHRSQGFEERKFDWEQSEALQKIERDILTRPSNKQDWFITKMGDTLAVIHGPVEFTMGAPEYEPGRAKIDPPLRRMRIPRSFAMATREVTVGQFQRFLEVNPAIKKRAQAAGQKDPIREGQTMKRLNLTDDCPQILMTWFEAAQYCNWLSEQEGIPEAEWCYPPLDQIVEGMKLPKNHLHRTGYRMPTEAEWEYASRAGASTSRYFGSSEALLGDYAWYTGTTFNERPWPTGQLKPNDLGLFDVYGNVWEWGHDRVKDYSTASVGDTREDVEDLEVTVSKDQKRPRKGGSYTYGPEFMRSAYRNDGYIPDERRDSVGFRIARTLR